MRFISFLFVALLFIGCTATEKPIEIRSPLPTKETALVAMPTPTQQIFLAPAKTSEPTSIPLLSPLIKKITAQDFPKPTQDLIFLDHDIVQRWQHKTGLVEYLNVPKPVRLGGKPNGAGPEYAINGVFQAAADSSGRFAAVVYRTEQLYFALGLMDLRTGNIREIKKLSEGEPPNMSLAFSPDDKWIGYMLMKPSPQAGGGMLDGDLYVISVAQPTAATKVGACVLHSGAGFAFECQREFLWSPDSQSIAYADGYGVWVARLGALAELLVTNRTAMPNSVWGGIHHVMKWSPDGEYLITSVGFYEGSAQGVIATKNGNTIILPGTNEYVQPGGKAEWLNDHQIIILAPGSPPQIRTYDLVNSNTKLSLISQQTVTLEASPRNIPLNFLSSTTGEKYFMLLNRHPSDITRGIYKINLESNSVSFVATLPPENSIYMQNSPDEMSFIDLPAFWQPNANSVLLKETGWYDIAKPYSSWLYIDLQQKTLWRMSGIMSVYAQPLVWVSAS